MYEMVCGLGDQCKGPTLSLKPHRRRLVPRPDRIGTLEVPEAPGARGFPWQEAARTMIEQAPRQVAVKVSPEGDRLITSGAHYLHMSKKDLVEAAVAFYLDARREEMQAGMRELLSQLDGSRAARIAMLADMTREELEAIGGVEEDD
jgi:hypothetical protein